MVRLFIDIFQIQGCVDYSITNKELGLADLQKADDESTLTITVNVIEQATGVTQSSTKTIIVYKDQIKLDFDDGTPKYFKPGFPFSGQVNDLFKFLSRVLFHLVF